jgi:hypothetical protein
MNEDSENPGSRENRREGEQSLETVSHYTTPADVSQHNTRRTAQSDAPYTANFLSFRRP